MRNQRCPYCGFITDTELEVHDPANLNRPDVCLNIERGVSYDTIRILPAFPHVNDEEEDLDGYLNKEVRI